MKLSIAICTFNRANLLKLALQSLLPQIKDSEFIEVLVIDNNSTDNTYEVTKKFTTENKNIFYYKEKTKGISYARNRAITEAKGEYIGFIDDDAQASSEFTDIALQIIQNFRPDIFGGKILPYYLTDKPEWFKDEYEIRIHGITGWQKNSYFSASNLFINKEIIAEIGGFKTDFGGVGQNMIYGEETELMARAYKAKKKIYYSLDLIVYHWVPDYKMHPLFFLYSNYKMGKAYQNITSNIQHSDSKSLIDIIEHFFESLNNSLKDNPQTLNNFLVEKLVSEFNLIGQHSAFLASNSKIGGLYENDYIRMNYSVKKKITTRQFLSSLYKLTKLYLQSITKLKK